MSYLPTFCLSFSPHVLQDTWLGTTHNDSVELGLWAAEPSPSMAAVVPRIWSLRAKCM